MLHKQVWNVGKTAQPLVKQFSSHPLASPERGVGGQGFLGRLKDARRVLPRDFVAGGKGQGMDAAKWTQRLDVYPDGVSERLPSTLGGLR